MSLSSLVLAHDAYMEQEVGEWNRTRHLMFVMVRMWGDPKKSIEMHELMPLPGDKVQQIEEDEILAALNEFKKIHNMN